MIRLYLKRSLVLTLSLLLTTTIFAQSQGKAKVQIKKSENGTTEEYSEEFELQDGQDIEDILKQLDLLDEFGQLKDGQAFEINIRKLDGEEEIQNYDIEFYPGHEDHAGSPFLGVMLRDLDQDALENSGTTTGALITEIIEDTQAATTDLQAGDVIVEVNDEVINNVSDLVNAIRSKDVGDPVKVVYYRDGKKKRVNTTLGERDEYEYRFFSPEVDFNFEMPDMEDFDIMIAPGTLEVPEGVEWFNEDVFESEERSFLGVTSGHGCGEETSDGARIGCVIEGSSAEDMGLMKGDVVTSFNGVAVNHFDELADQIGSTSPGDKIDMEVIRDGKNKRVKGEIGKRTYSECDSFKFFKDFKGTDEEGNIFYDYEFNFDEEEMEERLEDVYRRLEESQALMEERQHMMEMEQRERGLFGDNEETVSIRIEVEPISQDEAEAVNANAEPQLELSDDLEMLNISFFPNPTNGQINLKFSLAQEGDLDIYLYDEGGNIVYQETRMGFSGSYVNSIDISRESDGAYFLQIMQSGKTFSKKLIKNS